VEPEIIATGRFTNLGRLGSGLWFARLTELTDAGGNEQLDVRGREELGDGQQLHIGRRATCRTAGGIDTISDTGKIRGEFVAATG
jgi:hypothetical protein